MTLLYLVEKLFTILYSSENNYLEYVEFYGITQDPKTSNYMIVLEQMPMGNLRSNLVIKKYNPNDKYENLHFITKSLLALHKCNLVHGDFHDGNLLYLDNYVCLLSDFGLSRPAGQFINLDDIY